MNALIAQSDFGALFSDIAFDEAAMRRLVSQIGAPNCVFPALAASGLHAPAQRPAARTH